MSYCGDLLRQHIRCGDNVMELFTVERFPLWQSNCQFYGFNMLLPHIRRIKPGYTSSQSSLQTASKWIQHCTADHVGCGSGDGHQLPTRVLDLSCSPIRLHESKGESGKWACLSHCWGLQGESNVLRTTHQNISAFTKGIPIHSLTQTFAEAVDFIRGLGVQYVWIDSLCIIQDDPADWERESARMADIYMNSYVNIAASASWNTDGGCYTRTGEMLPKPTKVAEIETTDGRVVPIYMHRFSKHDPENASFPLAKRAWVFQEQLLSPRTIHFLGPELVLECRERLECECNFLSDPSSGRFTSLKDWFSRAASSSSEVSHAIWRRTIDEYSRKDLTYRSDKLPALSGLARAFSITSPGTYLAGLWRNSLLDDLLWFALPRNQGLAFRNSQYRAPTWSWASLDNASISYHHDRARTISYQAEVVKAETVLSGPDPTGAVSSGFIVLRAPAIDSTVSIGQGYARIKCPTAFSDATFECYMDEAPSHPESGQNLGSSFPVKLLYIKSPAFQFTFDSDTNPPVGLWQFLIVQSHFGSKNTYKRVGLLAISAFSQSKESEEAKKNDLRKRNEALPDKLGQSSTTIDIDKEIKDDYWNRRLINGTFIQSLDRVPKAEFKII